MKMPLSRRWHLLFFLLLPLLIGLVAWRTASWRPKIRHVSASSILALAWIENGQSVRCAAGDGRLYTLQASSLQTLASKKLSNRWNKAIFSMQGQQVFATDGTNTQLWNGSPVKRLWGRSTPGDGTGIWTADAVALAFSARGDLAIAEVFGNHGSVLLWKLKSGRVQPLGGNRDHPYNDTAEAVAFSDDGQLLAYSDDTSRTGVWGRKAAKTLWDESAFPTATRPKSAAATAFCFSPNGQLLAACFQSGETMILNARTGAIVRAFNSGVALCLAFSPDARLLAGTDGKGGLRVWNVASGQLEKSVPSGAPQISSLAFSPDSSRLAVGTATGKVELWRVR